MYIPYIGILSIYGEQMNPLCKVFSVIEIVVARQDRGTTYSDIIKDSNLPKSSVHRILKDLSDLEYLNFDPATKRYFGSLRLAALGAEVMANFQLRTHIHPFLLRLHQETEHTANFGILDGMHGVFVDKVESRDFGVKLFSEVGKTFPLHCTSMGKILIAFSPPGTFTELLSKPLEAVTNKTITDPLLLHEELALINVQGYAFDNEEITRGIMCVAGPIFDFDLGLIGAISIAFPASLNHDRGIEPEITAIKRYAALISQSFGGSQTAVFEET